MWAENQHRRTPINAFTVDVEDWYQAITSLNAREDQWDRFEKRVTENTQRLLALLDEYGVKATFFVLGRVAAEHPHLIRQIDAAGHEIGVHGFDHRMIHKLTPEQFSAELDRALAIIRPMINQPILGHRAPYFSINAKTLWALEILEEKGFRYDSSFFPTRNPLYGYPGSPRSPHRPHGRSLVEFPISTIKWGKFAVPFAGGFYLRLMPFSMVKRCILRSHQEGSPVILYMHPWELDTCHRYNRVTLREWVVQYTGRCSLEIKLRRLFETCFFGPLRQWLD